MVGALPPLRLHRGGAHRGPGHARRADLRGRGRAGEEVRRPSLPLPRAAARDRGRRLPKNPATAESCDLKRGFCGTVVALDETTGTIDLKRGRGSPVPHPTALVPFDNVPNKVLRESLARLAEAVVSSDFASDSPPRAAFDLLGRVPPRVGAAAPLPKASSFAPHEDLVAPRRRAAVRRPADRPPAPPLGSPRAGTARQRQDVHRSPDDPQAAGRRETGRGDRQQPQR